MVHRAIEAYDSWWSLLFEILGAWRRLMCAKQVISLVETMKSVFFPDLFVQTTYMEVFWSMQMLILQLTFKCVFIDDLHGSRPSLFAKKKI